MLPTPANSIPGSSPNYPTTAPASLFQAGTSTLFNMGSIRHPSQPSSDLLNGLANVASLSSPIYTSHPGVPDGSGIGPSASFHVNNLPPPPFQSNSSPRSVDTNEVVEALSKQIAYLEGDPGESSVLKVHYVCPSRPHCPTLGVHVHCPCSLMQVHTLVSLCKHHTALASFVFLILTENVYRRISIS